MAYTADLKSAELRLMWVRIPPPVPIGKTMAKPSDFYFAVDRAKDPQDEWDIDTIVITTKAYYDKTGYWCDNDRMKIGTVLPNGFCDIMESVYEYDGNIEEGRQVLLNAGFIENNKILEGP